MSLEEPIRKLFAQLDELLSQLTDEQYATPVTVLSGSTIGQHIRHVVECFLELQKGYRSGHLNYDRRKRDQLLQTNRRLAAAQLTSIRDSVQLPDKQLSLETVVDPDRSTTVVTSYRRELLHNLEHIRHHMALVRIALMFESGSRSANSYSMERITTPWQQRSIHETVV